MAQQQYDNTNRGTLFKNDKKTEDKHPDYNGSLNVEGTEYWLNAWIKTSKTGGKFMSVSIKEKTTSPAKAAPKKQDDFPDDDLDSIPF